MSEQKNRCPKCKSENVNVQIVTETKLKTKHHGILYWICCLWIVDMLLWIFLTIPKLIISIFKPKKQKIVSKNISMCVCQDCGHSWKA